MDHDPDRTILKRYLSRVITEDHVVALRAVRQAHKADKEVLLELVREIASETNDPDLMKWVDVIESF